MFRLSRLICHGTNFNNYVKKACIPCRSLYSLNSLGVDGYVEKREKVKQYFANDADKFRGKMIDFVENDQTAMIFTEDLKNMVHLADSEEADLELLERMLFKFNKQSKEVRFGNFVFGPIVMRFFYHIKNADMALKLFKAPELEGFFDQLMSYQILVDMLYEQGRYQDVIDVYQIVRSRQIQGGMYPRHVVLLVFAACYKENTPESFKFSTELWSDLHKVGHIPMRRAITFAAALALKQNAPDIALEIAGTARQQNYVTVRNIKVIAFTNLGRVDDALPILKGVLQVSDPTMKHTFTKDTIATVKEAVAKSSNKELQQDYNRLEKFLIENGHVSNTTLGEYLTTEINTANNQSDFNKDKSVLAASYNNNRNDRRENNGYKKPQFDKRYGNTRSGNTRPGNTRPGLEDLY